MNVDSKLSSPQAAERDFFASDRAFYRLLRRRLPAHQWEWGLAQLQEMGRMATEVIPPLAELANQHPPTLKAYDPWGERIDEVQCHPSYKEMTRLAYGAGLGGMYHDPAVREQGKVSHALAFGLGYVFAQAEQGLYCPICMTEGAARLVATFGDEALKARYLPGLTSRDPETLLQGAMFLTEKQGGSDVGANLATARQVGDHWELYGDKWFCSNAGEAGVMMVLARPEGAAPGTRGLGLFLMPKTWADGSPNRYRINRLKDKLGTRSMPSGEISLDGARAFAVGEVGRGFAYMTEMLNLSRIYNSVASVAVTRRALYECLKFSRERATFGHLIEQYPMVRRQLVEMTIEHEASMALVWEAIAFLDRQDDGLATPEERKLLRLLTPQIKYHTARQAVDFASMACEFLGGNGYIETFVTPRLLRDAQVLPIWEGTTNILVLDVLRCLEKEGAQAPLFETLRARLGALRQSRLAPYRDQALSALDRLIAAFDQLAAAQEGRTLFAKEWSDWALRVYQATLLLEGAEEELESGEGRGLAIAVKFLRRHFERQAFGAPGWGTDSSDHTLFEAIARHAPLTPEEALRALG
ncbi:acyl-CoA dehydrogenase family protein [bacterium]|nr:acyl-CoA dehydrogenase family protein [bacterium]